jgi:hypothetical protein
VHVVLRSNRKLSWREGRTYRVLRRVLGFYLGNPDFRICHISIQRRYLHLIVEAVNRRALTLGMQSFAIRAARALNADWGSCGDVFPDRYHSSQIRSARYAGWTMTFARPRDYDPLPVSKPKTWLLREGWKRYGLIDPHECPGPLEHTARW